MQRLCKTFDMDKIYFFQRWQVNTREDLSFGELKFIHVTNDTGDNNEFYLHDKMH